jgi:hypothetical protein
MDDKELFNSVILSPYEQELLQLNYLFFQERALRIRDREIYEQKIKENTFVNLLKKELGFSKLENAVERAGREFYEEERFQNFFGDCLLLAYVFYRVFDILIKRD